MWVLPPATVPLKTQAFLTVTFRACHAKLEIARSSYVNKNGTTEHPPQKPDKSLYLKRFSSSAFGSRKKFMGKRGFSCQAGAKSSGEEDDDLEHGSSELEKSSADVSEGKNVTEAMSEIDLTESEETDDDIAMEGFLNELEGFVNERKRANSGLSEAMTESLCTSPQQAALDRMPGLENFRAKIIPKKRASSGLFKAIVESPSTSVQQTLDKWVAEGALTSKDISTAMLGLLRRKMYGKALQLAKCVESQRLVEVGESSKRKILPNHFDIRRAIKWVQVVKKKKRPTYIYNWLLVHWKRTDKAKIGELVSLMGEERVRPNLFTYNMLIDIIGESNGVTGMEKIVETMKASKVQPDDMTYIKLAWHYTRLGLKEKAKAVLKELEGRGLNENREHLLTIYSRLGSSYDVKRVWKACLPYASTEECRSAFYAWLRLKNVREAKAVIDVLWKRRNKIHD